jgi:hypothetical protein
MLIIELLLLGGYRELKAFEQSERRCFVRVLTSTTSMHLHEMCRLRGAPHTLNTLNTLNTCEHSGLDLLKRNRR